MSGDSSSTVKVSLAGLGSRLLATSLVVLSTLILAARLGPRATGEYFLFLRVLAVLSLFSDLGFSQAAKVFAGRGESPRQLHGLLVRYALGASLPALLIFGTVLGLLGPTILPNFPLRLQIAAWIALPFFVYCSSWMFLMVGLAQIARMNAVQVGTAAVRLVLTVVFILGLAMELQAAVVIYVGTLIAQALAMGVVARSICREGGGARDGVFVEMVRFGLRGTGGVIAGQLWQSVPVFVLNLFHGTAAVGVFSVVQQLVERLHLPMEAIQDAVFRRIAQLRSSEARVVINRYVRISGWLMGALLLGGGAVIPLMLVLVLGPGYGSAFAVVVALLPGALAMSTASLLAIFVLARLGRPGLMSILALAALGSVAVLSAALVPDLAAAGAALAVTGTQLIGTALLVRVYRRATGATWREMAGVDRADRELIRARVRHLLARRLRR